LVGAVWCAGLAEVGDKPIKGAGQAHDNKCVRIIVEQHVDLGVFGKYLFVLEMWDWRALRSKPLIDTLARTGSAGVVWCQDVGMDSGGGSEGRAVEVEGERDKGHAVTVSVWSC